jgi:hypothetical protein
MGWMQDFAIERTTILSQTMDGASQQRLETPRRPYCLGALNRVAAQLTPFHMLPDMDEVRR